uniref:Uncharacterized protein n=1 Tax=Leersia perrieri TaxID=77586 RepID=A0A0D9WSK1_9ORYZ
MEVELTAAAGGVHVHGHGLQLQHPHPHPPRVGVRPPSLLSNKAQEMLMLQHKSSSSNSNAILTEKPPRSSSTPRVVVNIGGETEPAPRRAARAWQPAAKRDHPAEADCFVAGAGDGGRRHEED